MIIIDTGPFVALFDPLDAQHTFCRTVLASLRSPLWTTEPVLTEAFHILSPESIGSSRLRDFVLGGGAAVRSLEKQDIARAFELMETYRDHPMDFADASVIVAAERLSTRKVFTLDGRDFGTYRVLRGHQRLAVEIVGRQGRSRS
ncbi:MAG: PIN domain-containing protein [Deltaproteobacteria bacterium]|nr:PIN domain-containing protein [Deltaproteobacteria bacterium]